jgi:putative ABC transport system substrate-binding protein
MRRRDFALGLLLAAAASAALAEQPVKPRRIAIVEANFVASIGDPGSRLWQAFWQQLRRLGDAEGQNLAVARYAGEGRPEGYPNLARQVVRDDPEVIVAVTDPIAAAVHAANDATPIVLIGGAVVEYGLAASLAHPGGRITGIDVYASDEIYGKLLQILKQAFPSASKVAFLAPPGLLGGQLQFVQEASRRLQMSLILKEIAESTPSEYRQVFADIAGERADAIMVHARGELLRSRQLIIELAEKNRLPAMYPYRDYVEAGGLMAYALDWGELGRRMADDVHEILNGANPGDIPIFRPTKYELVINLKAASAIGLTLPSALLALADEVIE